MSINLNSDPIRKSFFQYLWPALTGMVIKSLFIIGDAWFISQSVGADGLGAISLIIPPFSIFTAIAMMIGVGGAARMSIDIGKGKTDAGQHWLNQSLLLVLLISVSCVLPAVFWLDEIIFLMGASGRIATLAHDFLLVLMPFFVIYSAAWVLSCFVRNDANPRLATYAMSAGAIANLLLDYLFIIELGWGMQGAAIATGLAQVIILAILLSHFVCKQGSLTLRLPIPELDKAPEIISMGSPTFFIELASALTILLFNYVLLRDYGESHIIAYGLTTNIGVFALFVMVGIAQACQPIISFNFGANRPQQIRQTLMLGLTTALGCGLTFLILVNLFSTHIAAMYFGDAPAQSALAIVALQLFFFGVPLMGINMVVANLFQAVAKPKLATLISLLRGFILVIIGVFALPLLFPENGIWASILFAEGLTSVLSLLLLLKFLRAQTQPEKVLRCSHVME